MFRAIKTKDCCEIGKCIGTYIKTDILLPLFLFLFIWLTSTEPTSGIRGTRRIDSSDFWQAIYETVKSCD